MVLFLVEGFKFLKYTDLSKPKQMKYIVLNVVMLLVFWILMSAAHMVSGR
jgi:hypothetical protein